MPIFFKRRRPTPTVPGEGLSVLDASLTIVGDIETDGTLRLDGRLLGSIRRADVVIIGSGATVEGNVAARELIVGGSVQGNIDAAERVELQTTAVVTGDIEAGTVLIQEGGVVRGRLLVRAQDARATRAPAPTPRSMRLVAAAGDAT